MTDRFIVIVLGLLVAALPFAAWLAVDGWKIRRDLPRLAHWMRVSWQRMDSDNRMFFVWLGRVAWCTVLIMVAGL